MSDDFATIDIRDTTALAGAQRLLQQFEQMEEGRSFQLLSGHDPKSLRGQLQVRAGDGFTWKSLEAGPAVWRVQVGKVAEGASGCCSGGACCG